MTKLAAKTASAPDMTDEVTRNRVIDIPLLLSR
jgi:hypothetical protein